MTEQDMLKETGRKAFQFLYNMCYGPASAVSHTYDRDLQMSLLDFLKYLSNTTGYSAKEISRNLEISNVLKELFSTSSILPAGQTATLPDIDDVNVLPAQQKLVLDLTLTCANQHYNFRLPVVEYGVSSSSGNETT